MLSPADHQRVRDALAAAEARTSGEIFCVIAEESGAYRETPFAWAAGLALAAPPLALLAGVRPWPVEAGAWTVAPMTVDPMVAVIRYALAQAILFAVTLLAVSWTPLRRRLTPGGIKRERVHARALEQFAHRAHAADAHTGVLIYASLAERRVEIIADETIHAQAGEAVWDQAVKAALGPIRHGRAADGLIAAIEACGAALARHCPADGTPRPGQAHDLVEL